MLHGPSSSSSPRSTCALPAPFTHRQADQTHPNSPKTPATPQKPPFSRATHHSAKTKRTHLALPCPTPTPSAKLSPNPHPAGRCPMTKVALCLSFILATLTTP